MPYTVKQLDNLPVPIVLATMLEPYDQVTETLLSVNEVNKTVARIEGDQVFVIIDMSQLKLSLSGLMQGLASTFLPHDGIDTGHVFAGRVRSIMIGTDPLMNMAVDSARQDQYGNRQIELFETVDKALAYIRQTHPAGEA